MSDEMRRIKDIFDRLESSIVLAIRPRDFVRSLNELLVSLIPSYRRPENVHKEVDLPPSSDE
jgi:hypothetical protein